MARFRGNPFLKGKNVKYDWTPELIEEYIKCKEDIYYFIDTYFKIVTEDGLVNMKLRDYQRQMIDNMLNGRFTLACMSRQSGKALDLNTPILTSTGMKKFGDIHVGDEIYSTDGKRTKITFETETMYNHECYNVEFSHGDIIVADADHVWTVNIKGSRGKSKIVDKTTKELKTLLLERQGKNQSIRIKIADPIQYEERELSIDPYILGLWLGDGTSADGSITCHVDDLENYKEYIDIQSIYTDTRNSNVKTVRIRELYGKLRKVGLLNNKHIPEDYLFNSIENRISLLQGLMDTDGTVTDNGSCEFYQKDKAFIDQFRFLLSTLGIKSQIREKRVEDQIYYTVSFSCHKYNCFRLNRKIKTMSERFITDAERNQYFYLKSITKTTSVPVKCIQVDNPTHLFLCGQTLIPTHNTETLRAFLIWYILFNDYKTVAIVANKLDTAMEIIGKLQISYQNLPLWLQLGVTEFNKGSFVLENNSRLFASATSADALRGYTCHIIVIDEAAHIDNWEEFYGAVSPTISAGKTTKLVMVSTPNGLNHFYDFYEGSSLGKRTNSFNATYVRWYDVPGRDEEWQRQILELMNFDHQKFDQEYNCSFIGSSGTLISGHRLQTLKMDIKKPIHTIDKLKIYEAPIKEQKDWREKIENVTSQKSIYERNIKEVNQSIMEEYIIPPHKYCIVADVSRGKGLDYSAFSVFDITKIPYRQVASYRDNQITPTDYAHYLYKVGQLYNEAIVLVEINDIGEQVSTYMMDELEYGNVLCTQSNGRAGKIVTFNLSKADKGVRTTLTLKNSGCLLMKLLVEENRLLLCDEETVNELLVFVKDKNSWSAEKGKNDDLAMGCVLFSWLSDQKFFLEWTSINTVSSLSDITTKQVEETLLNFGYIARDNTDHVDIRGQQFMPVHNMNIPYGGDFKRWQDEGEGTHRAKWGNDSWTAADAPTAAQLESKRFGAGAKILEELGIYTK